MGRGSSKVGGGGGSKAATDQYKNLGDTSASAMRFFDAPPPPGGERNRWQKSLTDDQKLAVSSYTGSGYKEMNRKLRDGEAPTTKVKQLDAAIAKFELKEGIQVTRNSSSDMLNALNLKSKGNVSEMVKEINSKHVGGVIRDKAFLSTTTKMDGVFMGEVKYNINVKPGKGKGAYVGGLSHFRTESEFLLKRNAPLTITGAHKEGGQLVLDLSY